MTHKDILLWVVAGIAIVLSVIALVAPKGQKSDAKIRLAPEIRAECPTGYHEEITDIRDAQGRIRTISICVSN